MERDRLEKYAEVVVTKGISLYKGQCVNIGTGPDDLDFALILEAEAYRQGAKYVNVQINSNASIRNRIAYSDKEGLGFVPTYVRSEIYEKLANDWAYIRIDNTGEMDALSGVDPKLLDTIFKAGRIARKRHLEVCAQHMAAWCVIASPNPKWAARVYGQEAPSPEVTQKFEAVIQSILRLDQADPLAAWTAHAETLTTRSRKLSDLHFDRLVFKNIDSNLEIGLTKRSVWEGGAKETPDGRSFIPNIPTEEVFTTPDYRRTNGTVRCTRPVRVMETELTGIWFTFKDGQVADFGADKNREILENFIRTDEGARALGEVALVDTASPIYRSRLVFNSILYDENASCHIALGKGYPTCLTNGLSLRTDEALKQAGCNTSLVHTDFMIGSDDLQVVGIDATGKSTRIIDQGVFVI